MFTIDSKAVVPVKPRAFKGEVTVYVRPATVEEFAELTLLPEVPISKDTREKVLKLLDRHIDNITGLEFKRGEETMPVKTAADVLQCPPWVLQQMYAAVLLASKLDSEALGKYERLSSGGASMSRGTAETVDYEE